MADVTRPNALAFSASATITVAVSVPMLADNARDEALHRCVRGAIGHRASSCDIDVQRLSTMHMSARLKSRLLPVTHAIHWGS